MELPHEQLKDALHEAWSLLDEGVRKEDITWQFGGVRVTGPLAGIKAVFGKVREDDAPIGNIPYEQEARYQARVSCYTWADSGSDEDVLTAEQNVWKCGEELRRILKEETLPSDWIAAWVRADIDESNKRISPALIVSHFIVVIQFQRW